MNLRRKYETWGLKEGERGELTIAGHDAVELASTFGTPLHVVHEGRLEETARNFLECARSEYAGRVSVHYPFKCNAVPEVVRILQQSGLRAEIMTEFELDLALHLGFRGEEIIVNGPCKSDSFLDRCLDAHVRFIIVDSIEELVALQRLTRQRQVRAEVLFRINPDYVPNGLNRGSATGSRRGCAFGLDLLGGEVGEALTLLRESAGLHFQGYHFHIGTGVRDSRGYARALSCLPSLVTEAENARQKVRVIDVGGGFATPSSREFTNWEMLRYQTLGILPPAGEADGHLVFADSAREISQTIRKMFPRRELPELIYEPGRCITSSCQILLLTVQRVKSRPGIGKWLIADGGLSTVTMPTYYEYHEVLLANDLNRPREEKVNIIGPACFAGDIIYRNKWMPDVRSGEVLAIMDTGAYFTAFESSFGFYRPALVSVSPGSVRVIRCREEFSQSIVRDRISPTHILEEEAA